MIDIQVQQAWARPPIPQVGAYLEFNSAVASRDDALRGSEHWHLAGSAVLVAPNKVLVTGHVCDEHALQSGGLMAVFLPFEGLFPIKPVFSNEKDHHGERPAGDYLYLLELQRGVDYTRPLPVRMYGNGNYKPDPGNYLEVAGFGDWSGPDPVSDGLQQHYRVTLGPHQHNLDLSWHSDENGGLIAGEANSGGPLLWGFPPRPGEDDEFDPDDVAATQVVAIIRESIRDRHVASWIGRDRSDWLRSELSASETPRHQPLGRIARLVTVRAGEPSRLELEVPNDSREVGAVNVTASATRGLRLRMKLGEGDSSARPVGGRFLHEKANLEAGSSRVVVTLEHVASSRPQAAEAVVQVCARFSRE